MNAQAAGFSHASRQLDIRSVMTGSVITGLSITASISWNTALQRLVDSIAADDESVPAGFVNAILCTTLGISVIYLLHRCRVLAPERQ